jgi:CxxC motif-containing protein (DUF1111 family)
MGITSPLQQNENTYLGKPVMAFDHVDDPEDQGDCNKHQFGEDVEASARFMGSTKALPKADTLDRPEVKEGESLFRSIGCPRCYAPRWVTAPVGTVFCDLKMIPPLAKDNPSL